VETLLGVRWQSKHGITLTVGGAFGADCGFGVPAFRFFSGITWQPSTSREQEEITRLQQRDRDDPDGDGMIGKADLCPDDPGPPQNAGCPDQDKDKDGIVDRLDECPNEAAGQGGQKGCPIAHVKGDEIVILDQVNFATDKDVILPESKPVLIAVGQVLLSHPEFREVKIEGHTDIRAGDAYNMNLSQRRVESVKKFLVEEQGIDPTRLKPDGLGHTAPIADDTGCLGPDDSLSEECKRNTSKNRRVLFRIMRRASILPVTPITGSETNPNVLPSSEPILPKASTLPSRGALPTGGGVLKDSKDHGVLDKDRVLPSGSEGTENSGLPKHEGVLPGREGSILPRSGTQRQAPKDEKKDEPKK
jgi:outer membrane protein OmpA-like peptidoglycan-associated protein